MREIKFRFIFDNMEKFVYTLDEMLDSSFLEEQMCEEMNSVIGTDEDFIEYKLIAKNEYTGLKDKNGVEIFEGDIVSVEKLTYDNKKEFDTFIGQVEYRHGSFHLDLSKMLLLCYGETIKVIGNIYENKDLLCNQK